MDFNVAAEKEEKFVFSSPSPMLDDGVHYGFLNGEIICLEEICLFLFNE